MQSISLAPFILIVAAFLVVGANVMLKLFLFLRVLIGLIIIGLLPSRSTRHNILDDRYNCIHLDKSVFLNSNTGLNSYFSIKLTLACKQAEVARANVLMSLGRGCSAVINGSCGHGPIFRIRTNIYKATSQNNNNFQ